MKKALALSVIAIYMASCTTSKDGSIKNGTDFDTTKIESGVTYYQCPMHADVYSSASGECPKCGMSLEKVIKK